MKRNRRFRRHTVKKTKYGGMNGPKSTKPMNPNAPAYVPPPPPPAPVDPFTPNSAFDTFYKNVLLTYGVDGIPLAENAVAIDCEMVGVGPTSALAHVAICDFNGNEIYNKYVIPRGGINSITNYRTPYSGIVEGDTLEPFKNNSENSFEVVKQEVHDILNGRIIVGHGLNNDFEALEYVPFPLYVWDSTQIPKYLRAPAYEGARPQAHRLKELAAMIGNNIQKNNGRGHSPLEDARAAMNLFRTYVGYPKIDYTANGHSWRN